MNKKNIKLMSMVLIACMMMLSTACSGPKAEIPVEYNYGDLTEYLKLGEYKGVEYVKITGDVSDEEVKKNIDGIIASAEESVEIKEGVVKEDSIVNIDYVGSIDGVEFQGGTAQAQELDIANSSYIAGFAEGIVGHKVGETFDLHVTFPEDYGNEELNGKAAVFKTTINALIEKKPAKFNDEWVAKNSEYKTTADYEQYIRDQMSAEKIATADENQKTEVFNKIVEASEAIGYPEKELAAETELLKKTYTDYASSMGMELADFITQMDMTEESFNSMLEENAKTSSKQKMVLYAIKNAEGISVKQSDYDAYIAEALEKAGLTEESFKEQNGKTIVEYANENGMFTAFLYKLVMDKVMEYSVGK